MGKQVISKNNPMNNTINVPTLTEFRKGGFTVNIEHYHRYKIAYKDRQGKIFVETIYRRREYIEDPSFLYFKPFTKEACPVLFELLPKGGRTEVTVIDPETKAEFWASAVCRKDENYNKFIGVNQCLSRIADLMAVCDGTDGFKNPLGC